MVTRTKRSSSFFGCYLPPILMVRFDLTLAITYSAPAPRVIYPSCSRVGWQNNTHKLPHHHHNTTIHSHSTANPYPSHDSA